jgi:hypothetical protein
VNNKKDWTIHGEELEGHQFNSIIRNAREAGHEVNFDDGPAKTIVIKGVTEEEVKDGLAWIESKTGQKTNTR